MQSALNSGTYLSLTQVMAVFMLIGTLIIVFMHLPRILPVINLILSVIYLLFVLNVIRFGFDARLILIGVLIASMVLAVLQFFSAREKSRFAYMASGLVFFAALTALLVYVKLIDRVMN